MMTKVYTGMFKKKNNELREMTFMKLSDIPTAFLETKIKAGSKDRVMPKGMELVWDVKAKDFRVFNYSSQVGTLDEVAFSEEEKNKLFANKSLTP